MGPGSLHCNCISTHWYLGLSCVMVRGANALRLTTRELLLAEHLPPFSSSSSVDDSGSCTPPPSSHLPSVSTSTCLLLWPRSGGGDSARRLAGLVFQSAVFGVSTVRVACWLEGQW